jgi:tetrahydromethanopterin S-methyltransferase subunit G
MRRLLDKALDGAAAAVLYGAVLGHLLTLIIVFLP